MSDALGDIAARLLATPAITDLVGAEGVFLDTPHDLSRDQGYRSTDNKPFVYFGPLFRQPLDGCGHFHCRLRIWVDSFASDRREAHALSKAVIAALDEIFGAAPLDGLALRFIAGGDVLDPFSPFATYADFEWTE